MTISFPKDANRIAVLGGTSSADGVTPVLPWVDPTTHRLLVDASAGGITIGTTTITSGTTGRILYDNAGVVGEYLITGTGKVVMDTSPTISSPVVGTQVSTDNSTLAASTAFVTTAISNAIAGVNPAVAVEVASAAKLPNSPTYNNGVSGVGAFITTLTTNTALVVDGYTVALNDRVLVKNEGDAGGLGAAKNGVYKLTTLHGVGIAWILTRALDYNQPSDINETGAIPVKNNGTANPLTSWLLTSTVATIGTDVLTYTQFSYSPLAVVPVTLGGTGLATLTANNVILGNGTSNPTFVAPSTSGNLLTSNGSTWQSTAPAAATVIPPMIIASTLNTSGDINQVSAPTNATFTNGSGSGSAQIATTTTSGSFGRWGWSLGPSNPTIYTAGMVGTAYVYIRCAVASTGDFFIGFGSPGATAASLDYATQNHMGFKFIANGSQLTMTPTVSDGTETAGSAINISNDNKVFLKWVYTSSTVADFYYSVNGAAYTKVTLTTHIPTGTEGNFGFSITNKNTATQVNYDIRGISLQF